MPIIASKYMREKPKYLVLNSNNESKYFAVCPDCRSEILYHYYIIKSEPYFLYHRYFFSHTYNNKYYEIPFDSNIIEADLNDLSPWESFIERLKSDYLAGEKLERGDKYILKSIADEQIKFYRSVDNIDQYIRHLRKLIPTLHAEVREARLASQESAELYKTRQVTCPVCHAKIEGVYDSWDMSQKFPDRHLYGCDEKSYFRALHDTFDLKDHNNVERLHDSLYSQYNIAVPPFDTIHSDEIKNTSKKLKEYIYNLFALETNIYSVQTRLKELYIKRIQNKRDVLRHTSTIENTLRNQIQTIENEYTDELAALELLKNSQPEKVRLDRPVEPRKPQEPVFEKPGLFNKKKILAHNESLKADYQKSYEKYESDFKKYEQAVKECELKEAQLNCEAEEKHRKLIAVRESDSTKKKLMLEQRRNSYTSEVQAATMQSSETITKDMLDKEIVQAEKMYKELIECRNKLYSYDIIYGKYRNAVALGTFYEYLSTGRCYSLEGPDGAYNIFENEVRLNKIIGNLENIVDSLKEIKDSQYAIYERLGQIGSSLNQLNSTMQDASKSLKKIKANTRNTSEYMQIVAQNSEVIAYNTAAAAYYSKMNAELTNSLGYLIALK